MHKVMRDLKAALEAEGHSVRVLPYGSLELESPGFRVPVTIALDGGKLRVLGYLHAGYLTCDMHRLVTDMDAFLYQADIAEGMEIDGED